MYRTLSVGLFPIAAISLLFGLPGCKSQCTKQDGSTICKAETTQQFVGTPVMQTAPWSSGQPITINVKGGNVRINEAATSIRVVPGSDPSNVSVSFLPIVNVAPEDTAAGQQQMTNDLDLTATSTNGAVVITAQPKTGVQVFSGLSARVDVTLPATFNGAITAITDYGDISLQGSIHNVNAEIKLGGGDIRVESAHGNVTAQTGLGSIYVKLDAPAQSMDVGNLSSGQGDIHLYLPAASVISLQAQSGADGKVTTSNPLPSAWTQTAAMGSNGPVLSSVTLVGNGGGTTPWQLSNKGFTYSNIDINLL